MRIRSITLPGSLVGADKLKALELYNGTPYTLNLITEKYADELHFNGNSSPELATDPAFSTAQKHFSELSNKLRDDLVLSPSVTGSSIHEKAFPLQFHAVPASVRAQTSSDSETPLVPFSVVLKQKGSGIKRVGSQGDDSLYGSPRGDILVGRGGSDRLVGGYSDFSYGQDILEGGSGEDVLLSGGGKDLLKGDDGDDQLNAGRGNDYLIGGAGDDLLLGQAGNDHLMGGLGKDTLVGGSGADTFHINSLSQGVDTITDFNPADDLLDLGTILTQPIYGDSDVLTKFNQFVNLVQIGANAEVRIEPDGIVNSTNAITLVILQNLASSTISFRNFMFS